MADEAEDELVLEDVIQDEDPEIETDQPEETETSEEEETVISFGDEEAAPASEESDTSLVRKLRAEIRERDKKLAEVAKQTPKPAIDLGPKPTLESCDYDEERFETELDTWKERKAEADQADRHADEERKKAQTAWQSELQEYERKKAALIVPGKEEAEEEAVAKLSQVQQAIIVKGADNPAAVMVALGKYPKKLDALSSIHDPVKFAFAVSKLERELKVTTRRKAPEPEGIVRGSAPLSGGSDKQLERLEQEAERTGDRSKVIRYKRQKAQATA